MFEAREPVVRRFVGGPMLTACYVLVVPGRSAALIDAPRDAWRAALDVADRGGAPVRLLVATHGHWDHITDAARVRARGIPLAGHPADAALFADPMAQRAEIPFVIEPVALDRELADGERLDVGGLDVQVLHTPGHSPGSITLWIPDLEVAFTGDTLLKGGAGYLERPECDPRALAASIRRLAALPDQTTVYPGHGAPTTIAAEALLAHADDPDALIAGWRSGRGRWTPRLGSSL